MKNNPRLRLKWQQLSTRTHTYWQGLALREKRLVGAMVIGVGGLLIGLIGIQPPLNTIAHWQSETPKLRAQTQTLDTLLQGLSTQTISQGLEPALRQSLDSSGATGHYQLTAADAGWLLTFDNVPADAALGWLLGAPRQLTLEVIEAHLQRTGSAEPDDTAGTLSGTVRMDQAQGAKEAS